MTIAGQRAMVKGVMVVLVEVNVMVVENGCVNIGYKGWL